MTTLQTDTRYWNNKFAAFMHDPFDKVFRIPGHEERAAELMELYGISMSNDQFWKKADAMAAGFERGQVPSFNKDETRNGAINYLNNMILSHPTSDQTGLKIDLPDNFKQMDAKQADRYIYESLVKELKMLIGSTDDQTGYSGQFKGEPDRFARARFFYTHLRLRFVLADRNIASLGAFWHRIPADSRFPDHSIWQHNALTSAFYSCMELSGSRDDIGMMVFSITPVQGFISRARKLRDYWTGSVLLSWLAFEGIRWVCENLGPDHILYPSLIDQPLINEYLASKWRMSDIKQSDDAKDIASFPNKFLFLIPQSKSKEIGDLVSSHIKKQWVNICDKMEHLLEKNSDIDTSQEKDHLHSMFCRQAHDYWDFDWAAVKMLSGEDHAKKEMEKFLPESQYISQTRLLEIFNEIIKDKDYYDKSGTGVFYSVTHSLVQTILAISKTTRISRRADENGEKCHLCGEFEILHCHPADTGESLGAAAYKKETGAFWQTLKTNWKREADFNKKDSEKLCAVCFMKRGLYRLFEKSQGQNDKKHILYNMFHKNNMFPSTTLISLHDYFQENNITDSTEQRQIAQDLYDNSEDRLKKGKYKQPKPRDKYYAILMMDGDRIGRLVNGAALGSTWKSVLHPEFLSRLNRSDFEKKYKDNWEKIFNNYPKRLLTPAIHAAISESLGDFAIYGAAPIVKKYHGRLIYAGGDDVCAVLPISMVLNAAREIRQYYNAGFQIIRPDGSAEPLQDRWQIENGKLSVNLGKAENISISAGILICHHKENLSLMITRAHQVLDTHAKEQGGRNACAIELKKRSGGSRFFVRKWDDNSWKSFAEIGRAAGGEVKDFEAVSRSLVYRLEHFRDGMEAVIRHGQSQNHGQNQNYEQNQDNHLLCKLIEMQLDRSSLGKSVDKQNFAEKIADIVIEKHENKEPEFKPEGLIISSFLKGGELK